MKKLFILFWVIISNGYLFPQNNPVKIYSQKENLRFTFLTELEGLISNTVYKIIQDSCGLFWIGTSAGLNIYDGKSFVHYSLNSFDAKKNISGNAVYNILETKNSIFWLATENGLTRIDYRNNKINIYRKEDKKENSLLDNYIYDIEEDNRGKIWVATRKGVQYFNNIDDPKKILFYTDPSITNKLRATSINGMAKSSGTNFYFFGSRGNEVSIFRYSSEKKIDLIKLKFKGRSFVRKLIEDKKGNLWLGMWREGMIYYDVSNNIYQQFLNKEDGSGSNVIVDFEEDNKNRIWISTRGGGLFIFDKTNKELTQCSFNKNNLAGINSNVLSDLYFDKNGTLWIGGLEKGINKISQTAFFVKYFTSAADKILKEDNITSFYQDDNGYIWIGTDAGKIYIMDRKGDKFIKSLHLSDRRASRIQCIYKDQNKNLWFGTSGSGLYKTKLNKVITSISDISIEKVKGIAENEYIYCIDQLKTGKFLFSVWGNGLLLYNEKNKISKYYNIKNSPFKVSNFLDIDIDKYGNIWIATYLDGIYVMNFKDFRIKDFIKINHDNGLPNDIVYSLLNDSSGNVWAGTETGFAKIVYELNKNIFEQKLQLSSYNLINRFKIQSIQIDGLNNLWMGTSKGILLYDTNRGASKLLTEEEGFQNGAYNINSSLKLTNGELCFGGKTGVNIFHPGKLISLDSTKSNVIFTEFKLFNKTINAGDSVNGRILYNKNVLFSPLIELEYDENVFTINFSSTNYIKNRTVFRYFLEGFSKKWSEAYENNSLTFTNLDPGEYKLLVKNTNDNRKWSGLNTIRFVIIPPFYQTIWFRIIIILFLVFVIGLIYRIRVTRIEAHNKELKTWNDELKEEIERRKKIQKEKERLNKILIEKNKELEQIIFISSHDLRTPLVNVSAFSKELEFSLDELFQSANCKTALEKLSPHLNKLVKEEIPSSLNYIGSNVKKMDILLKGLLEYSRIGRDELVINKIDINKMIKLICEAEYKRFIKFYKNIEIKTEPLPDCVGDYNKLHFLFFQIINNAFQYLKRGSNGIIEITATKEGNYNIYKIKDNGIGIENDQIEKIFYVYYKIDPDNSPGIGIGLSIAQKLAKMHDGNITVISTPEQGSEFSIILPNEITFQ